MLAAQRLWVQFPGNTHTDNKCITWMHCKSLWIKASAKCINVNVNVNLTYIKRSFGPLLKLYINRSYITLSKLHILQMFICTQLFSKHTSNYFSKLGINQKIICSGFCVPHISRDPLKRYLHISFTFAGISFYHLWHIMPTYATEQQVWAKGLFCFTSHLLNSASIVPYDLSLNHMAAVLCPLPLTEG